ncbi:ClpP-like prohead protease/major capsid protein fusion protein [Duganella aceris]|uniref:ATP-dependent Clp protease proteolytic subunit n=1 Tax=Duganella aceris TaxID=2703883 RepID=A0ABX0FPN6_9BURK|nr:ClpP-like prohead protease/major capsid protein fusion protein [Duganella aceris]NGZ86415.1 Clp protease ClpP [Duganella aceris]
MPTPTAQTKEPAKWYTIRASAKAVAGAVQAATSAEILIYGDIGESWYDDTVAAKDFVREVGALDVDAITVRINSFGGSVTDGIAIFNALKRHKATVTTVVDAIAASVASLIAMAGDTIEMAENALLMIHAPWLQYVSGNAVDLREYADMLDTYSDAMATSYASRSNDKAGTLALLQDGKDHWYTAEEALAAKFIDQVVASLPIAASAHIKPFIQARYASFPEIVESAAPVAAALPTPSKESTTMTIPAPAAAAAPAPAVDATQAAASAAVVAALAADKTRRTDITTAFAKFSAHEGMSVIQAACLDDQACTVDQANAKILAHLGKDSGPIAGSHIITLEDSRDKFRAGAAAALMAKAKLGKDDSANNFRSYGLMDLARECLAHAGVNARGMDKMTLVAAAFTHTGSDFPLLLQNVADKAMLKGYQEAEETFQKWTSKGTLGDFKPGKRVDLNSFPALAKIQDGGEYTYATVGDRGETVQLATYGKMFPITRQTIINDDLDAFSKIPRYMGRAAIRTIGDLVYAILTSNPVMRDNVALFHANHKNLMGGSGISTGSVDAMRVLMGKQTDGNAVLNIRMAQLLVPLALEGTANVVRDSEYEVGAATKNNTTPNFVRNTFEVISDARLDAASATGWYGTANSSVTDTVEVSYLDGVETPTLEQQNGWNVDGVEFKVRMDAGVAPLDFRTMVANPGA